MIRGVEEDLEVVGEVKSFDQRIKNDFGLWESEHRYTCWVEVLCAKDNVKASHNARKTEHPM